MGGEQSKTSGLEGFQIASVVPQSPAHEGGLIPYFDFVVGTDGVQLDRENSSDFRDYIKKHQDKPTSLKVYNTKTKAVRDAVITPNDKWGGVGLLGCSINWESVDLAQEYIWHITDVRAGSPAELAGLQGGRDYLVGMQSAAPSGPLYITMFSDKTDFHHRLSFVNAMREDPVHRRNPRFMQLLLLVYDHVDNAVREVMVDMGQSTSLGCDVANGYLHVVPSTPGDTRLPIVRQFYIDTSSSNEVAAAAPSATLPPPPAPVSWANPALQGVPVMPAPPSPVGTQPAVSAAPTLPPPPALTAGVAGPASPASPAQPTAVEGGAAPQQPAVAGGASPVSLGQAPQYSEPAWASALNSTRS